MKSIVPYCSYGVLLLAATAGLAQDQVPWVGDFRAACGMAAEQHRLVLLHFYNDNCGPCVWLDQNVFNKPEVAEAVALNYLAMKVHAGKNPQLAARYRVNQWPTDIFVTPSGLEVYRTISPKGVAEYIALLHQVAQQTGVGAPRQWKSQLVQATHPAAAEAQGAVNQAQQRWGEAVSQFQRASDEARGVAQQTTEQAGAAVQQTQQQVAAGAEQATGAARQWSQQATDAVHRYEQQAGDSYRHFREQADQSVRQHAGQTAQQFEQQAQAARQEWRAAAQQTTQQTTQQIADAARDQRTQRQQAAVGSPFDRRSAFIGTDPSPASEPTAVAAPSSPTAVAPPAFAAAPASNPPIAAAPPPQPDTPKAPPVQPPQMTNNPWVTARPSQPTAPSPPAFTTANATPAPAAGNPVLVPASEAPPIALDGFCPVTLLETVARDPSDRSAWKKGDRQFGAIHQGRTYLFTSPEQQQKFLASPDTFAPVLAGCDPVRYAERGEIVDGKRAYGLVTPDRRIFLFADEASRNRFEQSPANYSAAIQQAMLKNATGNMYR